MSIQLVRLSFRHWMLSEVVLAKSSFYTAIHWDLSDLLIILPFFFNCGGSMCLSFWHFSFLSSWDLSLVNSTRWWGLLIPCPLLFICSASTFFLLSSFGLRQGVFCFFFIEIVVRSSTSFSYVLYGSEHYSLSFFLSFFLSFVFCLVIFYSFFVLCFLLSVFSCLFLFYS